MKRALAAVCFALCLAPVAAAQGAGASPNPNAVPTVTPNTNARNVNVANTNANVNTNVNADAANVNSAGPLTLEVKPGQAARIVVGPQDGEGGGLPRWLSELIDILIKALGLGSILFAALTYRRESRKNREDRQKAEEERVERLRKERAENVKNREQSELNRVQREEELRWRKAQLAKELLDKFLADPYASDAMLMLDWSGRKFCVKANRNQTDGVMMSVSWEEMWAALRITELNFNDKEKYIRDCFDDFFGYMQIIEHYLSIDLTDPAHVRYPFNYYIEELDRNRFMFGNFIRRYHPRAADFIERIRAMEAAAAKTEQAAAKDASPPAITSPPGVISPPVIAYFLFDCPPGEERFILKLEDEGKIEEARAILSSKGERHVLGEIIDQPEFYNAPWHFHVKPESVEFSESALDFAEEVNARVEAQTGKERARFRADNIWHTGGARLLAELPASRFSSERAGRRDEEEEYLRGRNRVAQPGAAGAVSSPPESPES